MKIIFDKSESAAPLPVVEEAPKIIEEDIEEEYDEDYEEE